MCGVHVDYSVVFSYTISYIRPPRVGNVSRLINFMELEMITMKEWMELVDCRITEGSDYYGGESNMYSLSSWNGLQGNGGWSFEIIFNTRSQEVYAVEACDYTNNRAYRLIGNHSLEWDKEAWDDTKWIDLEVDDDFIQKALAIKAGEVYDTHISIPLNLDNDTLHKLMLEAHENDITLNQLVEKILIQQIGEINTK